MFDIVRDHSLDVAVLSGGTSSEREISLRSGLAVAMALSAAGHHVARFDPADVDLKSVNWHQFDACFIALHGGEGEDGRVQATLDELGVPYTGSGPEASRIAMSKLATKKRLCECGISTPPAVSIFVRTPLEAIARQVADLQYPLIIKPDGQGCSLGVGVARCGDELADRIAAAGKYEAALLAEKVIVGRELTVAVVGRDALPPLEIVHRRALFDFDAKFNGRTTAVWQVPESNPAYAVATRAAVAACNALDTAGLVRVDMIIDSRGEPWVLELNTVPGMTEQSLAPRAAAEVGLDMPRFCNMLVKECLSAAEVLS